MNNNEHNTKPERDRIFLLPVFVFLIGVIILGTLGYHFKKNQDSLLQSRVELNAMTYAEHMRLDIMQGIGITDTLEQIIISNDGEIRRFQEIAGNLTEDFIQSIQIAPGGVVTDIYPEAGNEAGKIDLLNDKDRGEISRYGRDNDVITMQGPFNLKQGGSGIAVRNPVFTEDSNGQREFWGFTIVIIRVPDIFSESVRALSDFGYDYKLYKNKAPWDDTYTEVYGSDTEMDQAVSYMFDVADTRWKLDVQPKGGWSNSNLRLFLSCGILIVLLLSGLISVITLLNRARATESRTAELNSKLQEALDMANAAGVAKTKFINNMSHDIRTPMNAIIGYTAIALKKEPKPEVKDCLEKIGESSDHLLTLINDVLDISRIESGKQLITPEVVDIRSLTDEVLAVADGFMMGRELKFDVHRPNDKDTVYVLADAVHIREVLVNVLSNAVKFTHDGGTVKFITEYTEDADSKRIVVKYTISDTGIGMSDEFQKHIFEEFTQENSDARTHYKGTGLGMTIVKQYVEMMHGKISVNSRKGEGTAVVIELPLTITDEPVMQDSDIKIYHSDLSGRSVLLAEDNDLNAEIARILLEEQGMRVKRVTDGKQALECFADAPAGSFDIILMDIMMPVMNGLEAARAIRSLDRADASSIPIVAMTANAFAEDRAKAIEAGMSDHIAKPISVETLINVISKYI